VISVASVLGAAGPRRGHDRTRLGERTLMERLASSIVSWTDAEGRLERWRPAAVFWARTVRHLRSTRRGGISFGMRGASRRPRW
jgi:hypothetical protein